MESDVTYWLSITAITTVLYSVNGGSIPLASAIYLLKGSYMEQKLIDLIFALTITAATNPWFKDKTEEQIAEWVRKQLASCNITVIPVGASHGILKG